MTGRDFLAVARNVMGWKAESHWRAAAIHAYYALFLECRELLFRWGFSMPPRSNVHSWVRIRFTYASNKDLRDISDILDQLVRLRNKASYDISPLVQFSTAADAQGAIRLPAPPWTLLTKSKPIPFVEPPRWLRFGFDMRNGWKTGNCSRSRSRVRKNAGHYVDPRSCEFGHGVTYLQPVVLARCRKSCFATVNFGSAHFPGASFLSGSVHSRKID